MSIDIKIINGMVLEFSSPKNTDFIKGFARATAQSWNRKRACWIFAPCDLDKLLSACDKFFPDNDVSVVEVEKAVTDRASDTRRKIIMGAILLKRWEQSQGSTCESDIDFNAWVDNAIDCLEPKDKVFFGHRSQVKRWSHGSKADRVTEVEV